MILVRSMAVLAVVAGAFGCSSGESGPVAGDAGGDGSRAMDARPDHPSPRETGSGDARTEEASAKDASARDASTKDASPTDASPGDVVAKDASTRDAGPTDASPGDVVAKDASQRDTNAGDRDAKDASPRDTSTKDASPRDAGAKDASSRDASASDSSSRDTGAKDASARDASAKDGRSVDASAKEGGSGDATSGDAADSAADGPLSTWISISPHPLTPRFSTTVYDYYVRCGKGTNTLTVTMTAAPGSTIALMQPTTTPPSTDEVKTLSVTENEAIVVGVTTAGTTDQYWIRCLPWDFPALQMTPHPDAGTPTPGYYLVGSLEPTPGGNGYAMALDGNGVPVWYHTTTNGQGAVDVENLLPGTISYVGVVNVGASGQFELHDLVTATTTHVEPSGMPLDEHELRVLPNGNYLMLSDPIVTGVNLTGLGSYGADQDIIGCDIQEVDPTGAAVWQWSAMNHFDPVQDSMWPLSVVYDGTTLVDVFHCNSIDVASNGDLLVSARQMDSVFSISGTTGAVLWKMGGSTYAHDNARYITVENDPDTSFTWAARRPPDRGRRDLDVRRPDRGEQPGARGHLLDRLHRRHRDGRVAVRGEAVELRHGELPCPR